MVPGLGEVWTGDPSAHILVLVFIASSRSILDTPNNDLSVSLILGYHSVKIMAVIVVAYNVVVQGAAYLLEASILVRSD